MHVGTDFAVQEFTQQIRHWQFLFYVLPLADFRTKNLFVHCDFNLFRFKFHFRKFEFSFSSKIFENNHDSLLFFFSKPTLLTFCVHIDYSTFHTPLTVSINLNIFGLTHSLPCCAMCLPAKSPKFHSMTLFAHWSMSLRYLVELEESWVFLGFFALELACGKLFANKLVTPSDWELPSEVKIFGSFGSIERILVSVRSDCWELNKKLRSHVSNIFFCLDSFSPINAILAKTML